MSTPWGEPMEAIVHLTFAFDIGYEIDLEMARSLVAAESGPLARRRRTPESIRYRPAPLRLTPDVSGLALPGGVVPWRPPLGELTLFDFAAIALTVRFPIKATPDDLRILAGDLADLGQLTAAARLVIAPWLERLKPTVIGYEVSDLAEEFVVFQLTEQRDDWLTAHADWVAGLVRLDAGPLSVSEIREATRREISYTPLDLVALDWAAGFVADTDCADTLQVIEFANVQLLEFRHIDDRLDDRIEAAYKLIRPAKRRRWPQLPWRTHAGAMRSVRELEIEATSLFERADNALKLIGDQYLSRIFELASTRFHLGEWQQSIRRKLDTVGDVYDLLVHQAGGSRMEFLEVTVIVLIAIEIGLALWRH